MLRQNENRILLEFTRRWEPYGGEYASKNVPFGAPVGRHKRVDP